MSQPLMLKNLKLIDQFYEPTRPSRTNTKKKKKAVLFIIEDWNVKESQEIPGVTCKFALRVQNEVEQRLT